MSKNLKKPRPFKYQSTTELPALSSLKTEWDLAGLYYANERDPRIEADLRAAEAAYRKFAKRWSRQDFTASAKRLAKALADYERLTGRPEITRPGRYFAFRSALDANDTTAQKQQNLIAQRLRKASDLALFFPLVLGKTPVAKQRSYLKHPQLKHYRYYLEQLFRGARHHLTEAEEKIIKLKAQQSSVMWAEAVEQNLSKRVITWKRKPVPVPEALELVDLLPGREKRQLLDLIMATMREVGEFAEHELTAIVTDVRSEDELRGYEKPYSAALLGNQDDAVSVENLVRTVSTIGFKQSARFYKAKAAYHQLPVIDYAAKYESIGPEVNLPFTQAVDICRDVFYRIRPDYGTLFDRMLTSGQIDVFPRPGKRGGAFMSYQTGHPVHVFLNHVNNFKSLETLAHEMGHAIHAARSSQQTPFYDGFSITTAETASTLFENLLFDAVYAQASPAQQTVMLHDRLTRDIATIQRQIAFFNCELEIHNTIYAQGAMSNEELRAVMAKHLRSYLGPAVDIKPQDGYSYVYVAHLRYGFYVYTYAFGQLMSSLMAARYQEDERYGEEIDRFLTAGESASVADIFASIGIDTRAPETFAAALARQAADIKTFSRMGRQS